MTIHTNDIVIDAGAWIGDFSAYASKKGATVYAFEPVSETFEYLLITKKLNTNIFPIRKGLGDKIGQYYISRLKKNSVANKIVSESENCEEIRVTTIDKFVEDYNIKKVDFIKADIEGFERNMLLGAKNTLMKFAPKLAICTYHIPDDPRFLESIIKEANPKYVVIHKKQKLFAAIPQLP